MPLEILEQLKNIITLGHAMFTRSMEECPELLTQLIVTLTFLQEDPTLHRLESEA